MIGSAALPEFDWTLVKALATPELLPKLLPEVAEIDPHRAEALAHAAELPSHGLRRWTEVERAMDELRATGLTATQDDVFCWYVNARMSSGERLNAILDDYYETTERS
jgi:hypothetical protein